MYIIYSLKIIHNYRLVELDETFGMIKYASGRYSFLQNRQIKFITENIMTN